MQIIWGAYCITRIIRCISLMHAILFLFIVYMIKLHIQNILRCNSSLYTCWWQRRCTKYIGIEWHVNRSGSHLNIKMSSYQYKDPHVNDKMVLWPSYRLHGNPLALERQSLYWDWALVLRTENSRQTGSMPWPLKTSILVSLSHQPYQF